MDFYRKTNRLKGNDYCLPGMYFITTRTIEGKEYFWGEMDNIKRIVTLSNYGKVAKKYIVESQNYFSNISVNTFVIMPNHIHLLIEIKEHRSDINISKIVAWIKRNISKEIGESIWQKSFYDRVIRNEKEFEQIWAYIDSNPRMWIEKGID